MPATIKDLARETGLGIATISSYLNGGSVRAQNAQKIEAAIRKLDFAVNETARSLKTSRTMTIGIVVPELQSNFFAKIISEAEDIFRHHGYSVIVSDCRTDRAREREVVDFFLRKRVDGLLCAPVDMTGQNLAAALRSAHCKVVLFDRLLEGLDCDSVCIDNVSAIRQAVDVLANDGHRRIGFIGGPPGIFTADQRILGYRTAMQAYGLEPEDRFLAMGNYTILGGRDALVHLLRQSPDVTAVIAVNDEMTVGCMMAVSELGLRIPEQLSIIGFDHEDFARACQPRLTIISQPSRQIARSTAELLLRRLAGETGPARQLTLSTTLMDGRSTLPCP